MPDLYRVVRKADGLILARGISLREARAVAVQLTVELKTGKYIVKPDTGPVERINVEQ